MSVISQLASSLNRRDEVPNQELAQKIVSGNNTAAVKELVENLQNRSKDIRNDCIKVLYEAGEANPGLLAPYAKEMLALLSHKDNRMQWGAMRALYFITKTQPASVYKSLPQIMEAAHKGSVITTDNAVRILAELGSDKKYTKDILPLLHEVFQTCPDNQLAMYAEASVDVIDDAYKKIFTATLKKRLPGIEKEPKRRRIEKVIAKLAKPKVEVV